MLHDSGSEGGIDHLFVECFEGETLARKLDRVPVLLDQALEIAIEIAEAVDKAHRQDVVHRDLKPANIVLTKNGAEMMDFVLAKPHPSSFYTSGLTSPPRAIRELDTRERRVYKFAP